MISEWQVLDWLNRYTITQLTPENQRLFNLIKKDSVPEQEKLKFLDDLINVSTLLQNLLEEAELETACGVASFARERWDDAIRLFTSAHDIYEHVHDLHRQVVVELLQFLACHAQGQELQAIYWADLTRTHLLRLSRTAAQEHKREVERWYRDALIDLMSDLLQVPAYVYEWQFMFHSSLLNPPAQACKERILHLLKTDDFLQVFHELDFLLWISQRTGQAGEFAEALAFRGLIVLKMKKPEEAGYFFKAAMVQSAPGSYEYHLMRWLLGLAQYPGVQWRYQATENMLACIRAFYELKQKADQQNNASAFTWFDILVEAMQRMVKRTATLPV